MASPVVATVPDAPVVPVAFGEPGGLTPVFVALPMDVLAAKIDRWVAAKKGAGGD